MTDKRFSICVSEAANYFDKDDYISDLALSSIWEDTEDAEGIPVERIQMLNDIWNAIHRSIPDIAKASGMSMRKLAERFFIPYRTVENWSSGARSCPLYVSLMMQEILGLMHRM